MVAKRGTRMRRMARSCLKKVAFLKTEHESKESKAVHHKESLKTGELRWSLTHQRDQLRRAA